MKNQYLTSTELFNRDYLSYIITHYEEMKDFEWKNKMLNPMVICKKYLNRSRHNKCFVRYKQNGGVGRFCAMGSVSLQNLPKKIRHTISNEFYIDIDMCNAHPIILLYMCKSNNFNCKYLEYYVNNRDTLLKSLTFEGKPNMDKSKKVYLSFTNGGKCYYGVDKPTDHLEGYIEEMKTLHTLFAGLNYEDFNNNKKKRIEVNKNDNHEASYMNKLLCDMENKILMKMYEYFHKPDNVVFCFDGLMLPKDRDYDIDGCTNFIRKEFNMPLFKLAVKKMDKVYKIPKGVVCKNKQPSLDYYPDFKNLITTDEGKTGMYKEWVDEWIDNSIKIIENKGKVFFLTRNKEITTFADKTTEIRDLWKPVKKCDLFESLNVSCNIYNENYDAGFAEMWHNSDTKGKKSIKNDTGLSVKEINKLIDLYTHEFLCSNKHPESSYLHDVLLNRSVITYNKIDFYPMLKRNKNNPELVGVFNTFTEYPYENDMKYEPLDFTQSLLYKHLQNDFFNNNKDELNHFLDHVADIIQDPSQIKGMSHLFYSKQGCGKGMLFEFMEKLLGSSNVISIVNTDTYFDKSFNLSTTNKLLKVFEEVSEKGSAYKNHDRLKGEQTNKLERVEPKGIDAYENRHVARYWYFTNNENSLYIEADDRRTTLHKISDEHQNNYEYFKPIWAEIKDSNFLKSAFEFFCDRKYDNKNVINSYCTSYKKEQKNVNLGNGVKFMLHFISKYFKVIEDRDWRVTTGYFKEKYKKYCEDMGGKYNISGLNTQIKKIGIVKPKQYRFVDKIYGGDTIWKYCYTINTFKLQNDMREYLQDDTFELIVCNDENVEMCDGRDNVVGL